MNVKATMLASFALALSGCSLLVSFDGYGLPDGSTGVTDAAVVYSGLRCGQGVCNPKVELCCFPSNQFEVEQGVCGPAATTCVGYGYLECASANDCEHANKPGTECCYVRGGNLFTQCLSPSECTSGVVFCDESVGARCEAGHACSPSNVFKGLSSCL